MDSQNMIGLELWLALKMSRLFGMTPLYQPRYSIIWKYINYAHNTYRFMYVFCLSSLSIYSMALDVYRDSNNTKPYLFATKVRRDLFLWLIHCTMTVTIAVVGAWTGRGRLTRIHNHFDQMTKANIKVRKNKKWREMRRIGISLLVLMIVTGLKLIETIIFIRDILTAYTDTYTDVLVYFLFGSYQGLYFAGIALVLEFIYLLYALYSAMETLNEELQPIIFNFRHIRPLTRAEQDTLLRIEAAYTSIGETVDQFNKTDGIVLLLMLIFFYQNLYLIMFRSVDYVSHLSNASGKNTGKQALKTFGWMFVNIAVLIGLVEPCHQFQREVDRMRVLMAKLMFWSTTPSGEGAIVARVFSDQLLAVTPVFAPLGVCYLSRSLLITVISASVTCLVFLAQNK